MLKKAVELINAIWINVDFENMANSRKRCFQDEFTAKVRGCATSSASIEIFIESICKKLNILSFEKDKNIIYEITQLKDTEKQEILKIYREQLIRVINDLMIMREEKKEAYETAKVSRKQVENKNRIDINEIDKEINKSMSINEDDYAF